MSIEGATKRPREDDSLSREASNQEVQLMDLNHESLTAIFHSLHWKGLLCLEQVNKSMQGFVAGSWEPWSKSVCQRKKIMDWSALSGNANISYKFNLLTEKALQCYLDQRTSLMAEICELHPVKSETLKEEKEITKKANAIFKRFNTVKSWNRPLQDYISRDLEEMKASLHPSTLLYELLLENNYELLLENNEDQDFADDIPASMEGIFSGVTQRYINSQFIEISDLKASARLFEGLLYMAQYESARHTLNIESPRSSMVFAPLKVASDVLNEAIKQGASKASLWVRNFVVDQNESDVVLHFLLRLACTSAQGKDYRALEAFIEEAMFVRGQPYLLTDINDFTGKTDFDLEKDPTEHYEPNTYPPMFLGAAYLLTDLVDFVEWQGNPERAEKFFDKGVRGYKENECPVPAWGWYIGAAIQCELENWEKAKEYLDQAIGYGKKYPVQFEKIKNRIAENLAKI